MNYPAHGEHGYVSPRCSIDGKKAIGGSASSDNKEEENQQTGEASSTAKRKASPANVGGTNVQPEKKKAKPTSTKSKATAPKPTKTQSVTSDPPSSKEKLKDDQGKGKAKATQEELGEEEADEGVSGKSKYLLLSEVYYFTVAYICISRKP